MFMTSLEPLIARTSDDTDRTYLNNIYNYLMGGTDRHCCRTFFNLPYLWIVFQNITTNLIF